MLVRIKWHNTCWVLSTQHCAWWHDNGSVNGTYLQFLVWQLCLPPDFASDRSVDWRMDGGALCGHVVSPSRPHPSWAGASLCPQLLARRLPRQSPGAVFCIISDLWPLMSLPDEFTSGSYCSGRSENTIDVYVTCASWFTCCKDKAGLSFYLTPHTSFIDIFSFFFFLILCHLPLHLFVRKSWFNLKI